MFRSQTVAADAKTFEPISRETIRTVKRIFTQCTVYLNVGSWAGH